MSEEGPSGEVVIRECVTGDDFRQCVDLEREVWNSDDESLMPVRLYKIANACNSPTIGAFDGSGQLIGFVHTMLALVNGRIAYHSHMAAVAERMRHRYIGYRMKLAQRQRALEAGIPLIFWTFDPLQARNAHININKLGAVIRRYEEDYYGMGTSPMFEPGVPSDRVFAEWWVASPHVSKRIAGVPARIQSLTPGPSIPGDIAQIRARSVDEHLESRLRVRDEFRRVLAGGLIVRYFERGADRAEGRYFFGPDEPQFHHDFYAKPLELESTPPPDSERFSLPPSEAKG